MNYIFYRFPFQIHKIAAGALLCAVLSSCSTIPGGSTRPVSAAKSRVLENAVRLQRQAGAFAINHDRFVVFHLKAAEMASAEAQANPTQFAAANAVLAASTAALAEWLVPDFQTGGTHAYSFGGTTFNLTMPRTGQKGMISPTAFDELKPASKVPRTLVKRWQSRPGIGAPMSPKWLPPSNPALAKFVSPRGYLLPVTALLTFPSSKTSAHAATLIFLDPTTVQTVEAEGGNRPLAADFSAPLVDRTRNVKEVLLALQGLIHPGARDAQLTITEPYDPNRIPVVFVHGLMSHPRMWRNVFNDLLADPAISSKFQFWVYYYPTGWPIAYSAMRFRDDLAKIDSAVGHHKKIVLIGHSMGGLLCRMQAISPGDAIVHGTLPKEKWAKFEHLPADNIVRKTMQFQANPEVDRIIFICTPHRGSNVADWSPATWLTKLVRLPTTITSAAIDIVPNLASSPNQYTSISRLSPSNPLYKTLEALPIQAPHHTIVGDRGRRDTPNSSDGVVAYWSSHLDSAKSELIVPSDHGAFDNLAAIAEVDRILKLELNH